MKSLVLKKITDVSTRLIMLFDHISRLMLFDHISTSFKSAGNTRLEALGEGKEMGGGKGVLEWLGLAAGLTIVSAGLCCLLKLFCISRPYR